jgi:hydroxyacylglutathione hydrolase
MKEIGVLEAKKIIDEKKNTNDFELIDVRFPFEHSQGHIKNSILLPLNEIINNLDYFKKDKTYILYCRSGRRSQMLQELLLKKGINAINMEGGIIKWQENNLEIER